MNKEELLNQTLYFVKSNLTEAPYFVNSEYFVLFTDIKLAINFAQSISNRLKTYYAAGPYPVSACAITDNDAFFVEMISIGFSKFSFNGEGNIFDLNPIYNRENRVTPQEKECYISYMGLLKMQKSSHIGSVKTQKIANTKKQLQSAPNAAMVQNFSRSLSALKQYYTNVTSADIPTPVPAEPEIINTPTVAPNEYPPVEFTTEKAPSVTPVEDAVTEAPQVAPMEDTVTETPPISPVENTVTNNKIVQKKEKNNRPIIATIFFIIGAIYFIESFFFIAEDGFNEGFSFTVCGLYFLAFAIIMFKMYLKGFGWIALGGIYLTATIDLLFSGEELSTIIVSIIITAIFGGLAVFANRKK